MNINSSVLPPPYLGVTAEPGTATTPYNSTRGLFNTGTSTVGTWLLSLGIVTVIGLAVAMAGETPPSADAHVQF